MRVGVGVAWLVVGVGVSVCEVWGVEVWCGKDKSGGKEVSGSAEGVRFGVEVVEFEGDDFRLGVRDRSVTG